MEILDKLLMCDEIDRKKNRCTSLKDDENRKQKTEVKGEKGDGELETENRIDRKEKTEEKVEKEEVELEKEEDDDNEKVKEIEDREDRSKHRSQRAFLSRSHSNNETIRGGIVKSNVIERKTRFKLEKLSGEQKKIRTFYHGISRPNDKEIHGHTAKPFATYNNYKAYGEDAGSSSFEVEDFRGPPCKKKKAIEEFRKRSYTEFKSPSFYSGKETKLKTLPQNKCISSNRNVDIRSIHGVGRFLIPKGTEQVNDKGPCQTKGFHRYQKPFDDTLTASVVKKLGKNSDSVGVLISFGRMVGTVFCSGEKYVLTANHVIQSIPEKCRYRNMNTFVNFNESPLTPAKVVFRLEKVAFSDSKLDVAVLEVSNPEGLPKPMKLNKQDHDKQNITKVSVIGFGHTSHQMKTLDPGCSLIAPDSLRIQRTRSWIREKNNYYKNALNDSGHSHIVDNELGVFNNFNFIMESFMEQGVSGAPAIAAFGDGSLNVTGLVTHGAPEFYHLLHTFYKKDNFPSEHRYAMGTKMKDIYSSIRENDPILAHALFG